MLGGDLIAVTTFGEVWRVTSLGGATHVASLGTHLAGVTTVPNSPATYGPWAGKILIGAEAAGAGTGRLYTVDLGGVVTEYNLGIKPEDIDIVPPNENFYGVSFSGLTTRLVGFFSSNSTKTPAVLRPTLLSSSRWKKALVHATIAFIQS